MQCHRVGPPRGGQPDLGEQLVFGSAAARLAPGRQARTRTRAPAGGDKRPRDPPRPRAPATVRRPEPARRPVRAGPSRGRSRHAAGRPRVHRGVAVARSVGRTDRELQAARRRARQHTRGAARASSAISAHLACSPARTSSSMNARAGHQDGASDGVIGQPRLGLRGQPRGEHALVPIRQPSHAPSSGCSRLVRPKEAGRPGPRRNSSQSPVPLERIAGQRDRPCIGERHAQVHGTTADTQLCDRRQYRGPFRLARSQRRRGGPRRRCHRLLDQGGQHSARPELEVVGDSCGLQETNTVKEPHGFADVVGPVVRGNAPCRRWRAHRSRWTPPGCAARGTPVRPRPRGTRRACRPCAVSGTRG